MAQTRSGKWSQRLPGSIAGALTTRGCLDGLRERCPGSRRDPLLAATSSLRFVRLGATPRPLFRRAETRSDRCGQSPGHGSATASTRRISEGLAWLRIRPSRLQPETRRRAHRDFPRTTGDVARGSTFQGGPRPLCRQRFEDPPCQKAVTPVMPVVQCEGTVWGPAPVCGIG